MTAAANLRRYRSRVVYLCCFVIVAVTFSAHADVIVSNPLPFVCGGTDPFTGEPNQPKNQTVTIRQAVDRAGNTFVIECVNNSFLQGTLIRADGLRVPFTKCVFTGGVNTPLYITDVLNHFQQIVYYNIDPVPARQLAPNDFNTLKGIIDDPVNQKEGTLNSTDTDRMKTLSDQLRQFLTSHPLRANIYEISFSPGDQLVERLESGLPTDSVFLSPAQAASAYAEGTGSPILQIDPAMLFPSAQPQLATLEQVPEPSTWTLAIPLICVLAWHKVRTRLARRSIVPGTLSLIVGLFLTSSVVQATVVVVDFANGRPPATILDIQSLTRTTGLDFSRGTMNIGLNQNGDGVSINPTAIHPVCVIFGNLSLNGFAVGQGVSFEVAFDPAAANSLALQTFQVAASTKIKIVETTTIDSMTVRRTLLEEIQEDIREEDIVSKQIDWVDDNNILIEINLRDGRPPIRRQRLSGLTHTTGFLSYRIRGVDISLDPTVSVGSIALTDEHVPEPGTGLLLSGAIVLLGAQGVHKWWGQRLRNIAR
jgi:hypothetical protein